ncbi:MAG: CHAD domain-containing protein [Terracidiphilus sp.]
MNSGSYPKTGQPGLASKSELTRQVESWRRLLADCGRKPSRRRVHGLRVATLRLQAETEYWLERHGEDNPSAHAVKRWNRQAEKLRGTLSKVRETDVYLGKLHRLRGSVAGPDEGPLRLTRICLRQIGLVERKFEEVRKNAANKLAEEIDDRRRRLDRLSKDLELVPASEASWGEGSGSSGVRDMIAGLATDFPELNGDNLHEFRKRVKKVRYVAEILAFGDPRRGRQVAPLKRMQSAVGTWHDWQTLAKKAAHTLRGSDRKVGLADLLETLAEESLQNAIDLCRRTMTRLLKQSGGNPVSLQLLPPKLPVRGIEAVDASDEKRFA